MILLVLHKLSDSLSYFDVDTGEELGRVATSVFPHEMCVAPDGRLYVSEYGSRGVESPGRGGNTIGVYDIRRRVRLGEISTGAYHRPHGIVSDGDGRLYVTSEVANRLLIFERASGTLLHAVDTGQRLPHLVAVSPAGTTVYTSNVGSASLTAIDAERRAVLAQIPVLERPEGMAFSPDGRLLYVAARESNAVVIVDTGTRRMIDRIDAGEAPVRLVITPDGQTLAFPLFRGDAVQLADTETRRVTATIAVGRQPAGSALSPDGRLLFVSCEKENMVYVVAVPSGDIVRRIPTGDGPDAMVCLTHLLEPTPHV